MADRHDASGYLIRHPELGDVEACAALHARVWQHAYRGLMSEDAYAQLGVERFRPIWYSIAQAYAKDAVPGDGREIKVAVTGEEPVGFLMHGPARDEDAPAEHQVWALNIAPEHHGSGLAQRLMDEVFGEGPAYLWVARGNDRAIRFYERNGFALDGTESDGSGVGLVEVRMVRGEGWPTGG